MGTSTSKFKRKDKDFSIFNNKSSTCKGYKKCDHLKRAYVGLKYYNLLCENDDEKIGQSLLVSFCEETYKIFLNDYNHIVKNHGNDIKLIANELITNYGFKQCNIGKCNTLKRHYSRNQNDHINKNENDDAKYMFYACCFDQLHHFIFHLYSLGLRVDLNEDNTSKITENKIDDDNDDINYLCVDKAFKSQLNNIKLRRTQCGVNIDRYNQQNNKFTIQTTVATKRVINDSNTEVTFMDGMYDFMTDEGVNKVKRDEVNQVQMYLYSNEYDSDAFVDDINLNQQSNILNKVQNPSLAQLLKLFVRNVQLSASSFSTGYIFFYWHFHKSQTKEEMEQQDKLLRENRHNGHSVADLNIDQHYESLKEEVLQSSFVSLKQWNQKIMFKALEYHTTQRVKAIRAKGYRCEMHGNNKDSRISVQHLCSIISYCDWSALCTEFSSTFRKKHPFETLDCIKGRNSKYFWFSKLLIESVDDFGLNGEGKWTKDTNGEDKWIGSGEAGPFYCGMSSIMTFTQFAIYLKGPCSTSKQQEIAANFATRDGIIIQLQNDIYATKIHARFFDCSFISNYVEEDERLWINVAYKLRMQTIKIVDSGKNFKFFFHSLYLIDAMLSNEYMRESPINMNSKDVKILSCLINNKLKMENINNILLSNQTLDEYVIDNFDLYCNSKKQIWISLKYLDSNSDEPYYAKLSYLLIDNLVDYNNKNNNILYINNDTNMNNILKTKIFSLFPNLNQIQIETTYGGGGASWIHYSEYKICLLSLLKWIESISSFRNITFKINATRRCEGSKNEYVGVTWLEDIISSSIKQTFNNHKWNITLNKEKRMWDEDHEYDTDYLLITKIV